MTETDIDRRRQILDAALNVFSRKGFAAATIKDIAKEAGLKSPALIYWYFPNKQEVLVTLLMELVPVIQQVANSPETLMEQPPEEVLTNIAQSFMQVFGTPLGGQMLRIFLSDLGHAPEMEERVAVVQKMMLNFFSGYLQRQIDLGRLRPCDTQSAARMFIGSLLAYVMSSEVFHWLKEGLPDPETYATQVVENFLKGMKV
jgi:TetR/AcrR family transcriptional regulator